MISGWKTFAERPARLLRGAWLAALLALASWAAPASWAASAFDLDGLMAQLAATRDGQARFTEQRFVRGIEGPLESRGTLRFSAPDRLERRTESPRQESMLVEGNTLTLSRSGRTRTMALDSMPELRGMVDAMRGTLNGDAAVIRQQFRATLDGTVDHWALQLEPLDQRLAAQVRSLRLTGRAGEVLGVEMEFIGGDRSVMRITPIHAAKAPS